jgi:hypothetical protein
MAVAAAGVLVLFLLITRMFAPLLTALHAQQATPVSLLPLLVALPPLVLAPFAFLLQVSRLQLLTTGGPVILASTISLTHPHDVLVRFQAIQHAIEVAKSKRKK